MPPISRSERVKPCLLDRIADDDGEGQRGHRAFSTQKYRKAVLRDLLWLFNTGAPTADTPLTERVPWQRAAPQRPGMGNPRQPVPRPAAELGDYPEAYNSVLAFGIPDLSGLTSSDLDLNQLQEELEAAVKLFEPRIDPKTVRVRAIVLENSMEPSVIAFEIEGELWMEDMPEHLRVRTMIDLEIGQCSVSESDDGPTAH